MEGDREAAVVSPEQLIFSFFSFDVIYRIVSKKNKSWRKKNRLLVAEYIQQ